jgi:tetratricopeptide (TPR) repeat protein
LAQLFSDQDSLEIYRQGIKVLQATTFESEESKKESKKELSSAYCAIAELYMTDLCDESEAENECTNCIKSALEADASNPEAWQTKARLHLIKSEFSEAKNCLDKSLAIWLPSYMAVVENRPHEAAAKFDPVEVIVKDKTGWQLKDFYTQQDFQS